MSKDTKRDISLTIHVLLECKIVHRGLHHLATVLVAIPAEFQSKFLKYLIHVSLKRPQKFEKISHLF